MGQVHQVRQEQVQTDPYYTVYLQVATYVGQVRQEQMQTDLLLDCLSVDGDLCGPGAPGAGAYRSPIRLFICRWRPVWGRCTRWARSRCRRTTCRLSSTSPASPSGSPPAESPSRYTAYMPLSLALLPVLSISPISPFASFLLFLLILSFLARLKTLHQN